jgi:ATP-dependent exoDNAse (exonuclease V) beta subunit
VADGHKLMQGEIGSIRDPFIRAFGNYDKMVDFAESTDDRELKSLIRVCGKYGRDVPLFVKAVANCAVESNKADVTLMTAHKSKGLEFSNVRLTDDFTDLLTKRGDIPSMQDIKAEELNVLYVAATRAKTRLEVNGNLASFLKRASEDPKSPITKELTRRLDAASSAPQVLTSSAAIRNLVKSRKANIKEYVFGGKFNPEF